MISVAILFIESGVIRDCRCGLRYMRHAVVVDRVRAGVVACACGRRLERWHGKFWLDYEPEERVGFLH